MVIAVNCGFLTSPKGIPVQLKKKWTGPIKHICQRVTNLQLPKGSKSKRSAKIDLENILDLGWRQYMWKAQQKDNKLK